MKARTLLFLRATLGCLLIWWGLDKLIQVEHGVQIAEHFYWGVGTSQSWLRVAGALEIPLGALVVLGLGRRWAYPAQALADTNVLFYPSVIVFAASLVLWAFRDEDRLALDGRLAGAHT